MKNWDLESSKSDNLEDYLKYLGAQGRYYIKNKSHF